MSAVRRASPSSILTVFDHGRGIRDDAVRLGDDTVTFRRCGGVNSRRYYRLENLWTMRLAARFGGLGHPHARLIRESAAILDISGGDSFTDLYHWSRFQTVALPKLIALEQGRPLILLPQTYGPFHSPKARAVAADIVRRARIAWARDLRSFDILRDLLGDAFDPSRHRCGVDVAFSLPATPPPSLPVILERWLADKRQPLIGLNVSGLIRNNPDRSVQYGFKADYRQALITLSRRLLADGCRLLLVPHVVTPPGHYESDLQACAALAADLGDSATGSVAVLPGYNDPCQMKWVIAHCDWFCGTRMHSTIAALSAAVTVAAIAYSDKTQGVFETCGQGEHVVDPRKLTTDELVDRLVFSWQHRSEARTHLRLILPHVRETASLQLESIVAQVTEPSSHAEPLPA